MIKILPSQITPGSDGQVLQVQSGQAAWAAAPSGGGTPSDYQVDGGTSSSRYGGTTSFNGGSLTIQARRDTGANWTTANPILAHGEIGLNLTNRKFKVGDGVTAWSSLGYNQLTPEVEVAILTAPGAQPSVPLSGANIYSQNRANRMLLGFQDPGNLDHIIQPSFFTASPVLIGVGSSNPSSIGGTYSVTGTYSNPTLNSANVRLSTRRFNLVSGTGGAAGAGLVTNSPFIFGNTAGVGGFYASIRFAVPTTLAAQRLFIGFTNNSAVITGGTFVPANMTSGFGIGYGSSETDFRFYNNDASGTATVTPLGSNFPARDNSIIFEFTAFADVGSPSMAWSLTRLDTNQSVSGTASTDLPNANELIYCHAHVNNGETTSAVSIDIIRFYVESEN